MYFTNRTQAGGQLAEQLAKYRYENCIVVALSESSVLVAEPIAQYLHCIITLLLTEDIELPGEHAVLGTVDQAGSFTYNSDFSQGELDEYRSEFFNYIESEKLQKFHRMNRMIGDTGLIDADLLQDHVVILVADGLKSGSLLDAALNFLKPVRTEKLVIATPLASVQAVDKMHIAADEIFCLNVTDNYLDTNHYYDDNSVPGHQEIVAKIQQIMLNWR